MYAILETGGKQVKVMAGDVIKVETLSPQSEDNIEFDRVLAVASDEDVTFGSPYVDGARVSAELLGDGKHRKVTVFKMKRRKGYRKKQGHRQSFSQVRIVKITVPE